MIGIEIIGVARRFKGSGDDGSEEQKPKSTPS